MKGAREISWMAQRSHTLFRSSFWEKGGTEGDGGQSSKPPCKLTNGPWLKQLSLLSAGVADKSQHVDGNQSVPRRVHRKALRGLAQLRTDTILVPTRLYTPISQFFMSCFFLHTHKTPPHTSPLHSILIWLSFSFLSFIELQLVLGGKEDVSFQCNGFLIISSLLFLPFSGGRN